jgi:hypothetical protein
LWQRWEAIELRAAQREVERAPGRTHKIVGALAAACKAAVAMHPYQHLALVDLVHPGESIRQPVGQRAAQQLEAKARVAGLAAIELLRLGCAALG